MPSLRKYAPVAVKIGSTLTAEVVATVETPALVIDERVINQSVDAAECLKMRSGVNVLYTLKPLGCPFVLDLMKGKLDGFAASSLFEARLARSVLGDRPGTGSIHLTTPGFRSGEMEELTGLCDFVAFNSLGQLERFGPILRYRRQMGLRINPELSLVEDDRYNPCRPHSKLGSPIETIYRVLRRQPDRLTGLGGLHFHTNCDARDTQPLERTVRRIEQKLGAWLSDLRWMNLGGGYLLDEPARLDTLVDVVRRLRKQYGLEVFIEPGAAFVRASSSLVAEVIDLFRSGGRTVAVLDTTINHFPEVFEYQFEPDVAGHDDDGDHEYFLVGSSCLAGDVFGEYAFAERLMIGSRVELPGLGAYALVKSHMFNGINLPTIYSIDPSGALVERRRFTYHDFLSRTGAPIDASL